MKKSLSWEVEKLFFSHHLFSENLIAGLKAATFSIDIEVYTFAYDQEGLEIATLLKNLSEKGIKVRLMVDGIGSANFIHYYFKEFLNSSVEVRIYHPIRLFKYWNKRNHRKTYVIDKFNIWAGGMNISQEHLNWRDTGVYVKGLSATSLNAAFNHCWEQAWYPGLQKISHFKRKWFNKVILAPLRLNTTILQRRRASKQLRQKFKEAKKNIWITNAYFVPPRAIIQILINAAKSKIDVCLILPHKSDFFFNHLASSALYGKMLKANIRIYEYLPTFLHAKSMIIDDWMMVGSSNFNSRSFIHDLEVDIILEKKESLTSLQNQFILDCQKGQKITWEIWRKRPWVNKILGRFFLLFRYWM